MANILAPEQYVAFAAHICGAHSWHKHLPLLEGGRFVVFLAADAGTSFPPERPRAHHSRQTSAEYRARFGQLDYLWSTEPDGMFVRDNGPLPDLPEELWEHCSLRLYPYASDNANAIEAIGYAVHAKALERLRAGTAHPQRKLVLEWADLHMRETRLWGELTDEERLRAVADEDERAGARDNPTAPVHAYLAVSARLHRVYAVLQASERRKIVRALDRLRQWLEAQGRMRGAED